MASSLATAASASAAASVTKPSPATAALHHRRHDSLCRLSFPLSRKPKLKLRFFSKGLLSSQNRFSSTMLRAELNEVADDGSSNDAATPTKSELPSMEPRDGKPPNEPASTEESISDFIAQVASLVKLVDSRDVVELRLKQRDCEVMIRKKEAVPQTSSPAPVAMVHSPQLAVAPSSAAPTLPAPTPLAPAPVASTSAKKSSKSLLPPLKSPMAGTFYQRPAPGEPPFVKVGDKVQKGQVLCIIEAMKLMNEIEADQSGTIVEVLAEDGKPVSFDTPLFVIQP